MITRAIHRARPRRLAWLPLVLVLVTGCERGPAAWRRDLADGNPAERRLAALALRAVTDEELRASVRVLLLTLGDGDPEVAGAADDSLRELAPRAADELLAVALQYGSRPRLRARIRPYLAAGGEEVETRLARIAVGTGARAETARALLEELSRPVPDSRARDPESPGPGDPAPEPPDPEAPGAEDP